MTWHSYRILSDTAVLLVALGVLAYCWLTPKRRLFVLGFTLIAAGAADDLVREATWPARGNINIVDLCFTVVDSVLVAAGFIIILRRWRRLERAT